MSSGFSRRHVALAALSLNAVRPWRGDRGGIPSFALGWPVSELAPHLLGATALDVAAELTVRRRRSRPSAVGLAAAAATAVLLGQAVASARRVGTELDDALRESIGEDYLTTLDLPGPLDLRLPRGSVSRPFRLRQHDVEVLRDVPYTEGGRRAHLDIYRPRDTDLSGAPVLLQIHGGGWTIGTKEQQGLILMNRMAQQGWVCVAANYRLAPKHRFPTQIIDVKRAIAWVHENIADFGGDPTYLAITGGSAGGHLSALAALTPGLAEYQPGFEDADTSVSACVPFYGIYDLAGLTGERSAVALRDRFLAPWVFKKDPRTDLEDFVRASPLAQVTDHTPDFFVVHGANDTLAPVLHARALVAALRERSDASVTYAELPGTQHAFDVFSSIRSQHTTGAVQRWLQWHRATHVAASAAG
ncbi:hydrolase, alpha/beta domain protein [Aeromicrobium marinum DSM 15272]|uniref:Hydrolase, alpha/beta domain protein n=1 Tax=Aeromicrobium marinum DSM 15272 TaxID=585531 RepID=E2SEU3_9ACTN|nr:alpha/beta hydrolase [Aeromicrobium marinum]EFQ82390.1 hydrolase, alpha/beta domain protein [Aeromicrobium marinum DSM 15272]